MTSLEMGDVVTLPVIRVERMRDDWSVTRGSKGMHVMPANESGHVPTPQCKCGPTSRGGVWVHHSNSK